jgi:uncharacterized protein
VAMNLSPYMKRHLRLTAMGHVVPSLAAAALMPNLPLALFAALVVMGLGLALFVPLTRAYLRGERRGWRSPAFDVPYFVHWTAGLLAIALVLPAMVLMLVMHRHVMLAFPLAYVAGLLFATWGSLVRRHVVETQRVEIPIHGLHPSFDGYRIAHLSDMHIGAWTPRALIARWARITNALAADLVVVTGDMVTNGAHFHEDIADAVGALRGKDGVVVAMGNHDYFGDGEGLITLLRARGARVLRNASEPLERGGNRIRLAAIDDRWSRRANLDEALREVEPREHTILLAHDPVDFGAAASRGVDLVLSGHTHGGQLAVPGFARHANLSRFIRKHTLGVYRNGWSRLVVHPGLGTSGPPVRVGVAPAIVEITLRTS